MGPVSLPDHSLDGASNAISTPSNPCLSSSRLSSDAQRLVEVGDGRVERDIDDARHECALYSLSPGAPADFALSRGHLSSRSCSPAPPHTSAAWGSRARGSGRRTSPRATPPGRPRATNPTPPRCRRRPTAISPGPSSGNALAKQPASLSSIAVMSRHRARGAPAAVRCARSPRASREAGPRDCCPSSDVRNSRTATLRAVGWKPRATSSAANRSNTWRKVWCSTRRAKARQLIAQASIAGPPSPGVTSSAATTPSGP